MKERFHRLLAPAMFNMCFINVIRIYLETSKEKFNNENKRFLSAVIEGYKFPINPHIVWFLFDLFSYSIAMVFLFKKWHPNHENQPKQNKFDLCRVYNPLPKNHEQFSRFITKTIVGPIKLILIPGIVLTAVEFGFRSRFTGPRTKPWLDWCNHMHYIWLYIIGYAIMSVETLLDSIMRKYGKLYLFSGTILLCLNVQTIIYPEKKLTWFSNTYNKIFLNTIHMFGQWMFMIGLYATAKTIATEDRRALSLCRFSKLTMPFYLVHRVILAGVSNQLTKDTKTEFAFATNLFFTTLLSLLASYIIHNSPMSVKYCFGMAYWNKNTTKNEYILVEFGPILLLISFWIFGCLAVEYITI